MTPIEYIGPSPQKKRKNSIFGGWVIVLLPVIFITFFAWPSFAKLFLAQDNKPTIEQTKRTLTTLRQTEQFGDQLAAAALEQTLSEIRHDGSVYNNLDYPNGDIPSDRGNNADLIIRAYRSLNIDLQQLVHEDMTDNFHAYPQLWNAKQTDPNIDHRRVKNLQRFFERKGQKLPVSKNSVDYQNGDIVIWHTPTGKPHIGIIAPGSGAYQNEQWVVHHASDSLNGPLWNDQLFDYEVIAHLRYEGSQ